MNYSAFISHGGGPLPLMNDAGHADMVKALKELADSIAKPAAIIVLSAHWETPGVYVNTQEQPELLYDYYGFPKQAYDISYPVRNEVELAQQILTGLQELDVPIVAETQRGFDHGLFVPLAIMYPKADIPCVQVSLHNGYDPQLHMNIGKCIAQVISHYDNVLVLGSGFSFHNMKAFSLPDNKEAMQNNLAFEQWLNDVLNNSSHSSRAVELNNWESAPGARFCHPTEEHLLPLHVAYGAAQSKPSWIEQVSVIGKMASFVLWEIP